MTVIALGVVVSACKSSPAEPEAPGAASAVGAAAEAVAPLLWDVPPTWTSNTARPGSAQKAAYRVPKAGDAKAEAEVVVVFLGTGSVGDVDKTFGLWSAEFESPDNAAPTRAPLDGGRFPIDTLEAAGKYKVGVGPQVGRQKKNPMQMMREHYRLVGAVVKTPDRGNWFFKMTGPEDTVAASRDAFLSMVRSAH